MADLHEKGPLLGSKRKEVIESVIKTVQNCAKLQFGDSSSLRVSFF